MAQAAKVAKVDNETPDVPLNCKIINQQNAQIISPHGPEKRMLRMGNLWHKIIIHGAAEADRETVLKLLLNAVQPLDLIPVNYTVEGQNAHFMARNCGLAIIKLCQDNLIIQNPSGPPYLLTVILGFSNTTKTQLNVQNNIKQTILSRFHVQTKVLNLENFHQDKALSELIFCVLSQPKILYFVLHLSKPLNFTTLRLNKNELKNLNGLENVNHLKHFKVLDLRNNLIDSIETLRVLKDIQLTELWLDGNPICQNYNEATYIQAIKGICPTLEKLDGVVLGNKGFLPFRRNYLESRECQKVIDQFMQHYFTLYDGKNRKYLKSLYNKDAMFSLTSSYIPNQSTSPNAALDAYVKLSRNLLKLCDVSKNTEHLYVGPDRIMEVFRALPETLHDPYTFACDTPVASLTNQIVMTITGAFRNPTTKLLDVEYIYGFSRTFILKAIGVTGEYQIFNDMLHVTNATTNLSNRSFKLVRTSPTISSVLPPAELATEKNEMVTLFCKLTTLKNQTANGMLANAKWNLQAALTSFVRMYKANQITMNSFQGN